MNKLFVDTSLVNNREVFVVSSIVTIEALIFVQTEVDQLEKNMTVVFSAVETLK